MSGLLLKQWLLIEVQSLQERALGVEVRHG